MSDLWETVCVTAPDLVFLRKKPAQFRCPACSKTFDIDSYEGHDGPEKLDRLAADYERHFKDTHAKN
jgi:hypothetical protein